MEKVVTYGTLKRGHGNHDIMLSAGGTYLGDTIVPSATMFSLGAFPAISFDAGDGIKGEVYEIETLTPIDRLEGYPNFYQRDLVSTPYGRAWVYYMSPMQTLRMPIVEEGEW